ncbi:uncharacterized protein LOC127851485 [Dreissena polymorpha]|uniref:Transmembrane protein 242 n=1 Tax=Dreissena polymorpha TaxID=45954 RepID=A0A9D4CYB6_DREPO|nr:uncharacterized protein LOC127851485 [Dreissena polymorpha]KAH3735748.1 hypothetical protein DPMN_042283 [Dreissena polymorpha]
MAAPMDKDSIPVSEEKTAVVLKDDRNWTHYLLGLTLAFGVTAGLANYRTIKKESRHLDEAVSNPHLERVHYQRLTARALGIATIITVPTFGLLVLGVYKLLGVSNIREFDAKMREYFPKKPSVGRTEFKDLQDLADYLVSEDRKAEMTKLNKQLADETEGFTDSSCEHS